MPPRGRRTGSCSMQISPQPPAKPQLGVNVLFPPPLSKAGMLPGAIPHPAVPDAQAAGEKSASSAVRQGSAAPAATRHLPGPAAAPRRPARAGSCSRGSCWLVARPGRKGFLPRVSPSTSLPARTGALLQPGQAGVEGKEKILQGHGCL